MHILLTQNHTSGRTSPNEFFIHLLSQHFDFVKPVFRVDFVTRITLVILYPVLEHFLQTQRLILGS